MEHGNRLPYQSRRIFLFLVLLSAVFSLRPVQAQAFPAALVINGVDESNFPEVRLFAQMRDRASGSLLRIPDSASFFVYEDGGQVKIREVREVDTGIQMVVLVDSGDGLLNTGVALESVYSVGADLIRSFAAGSSWMKPGIDEVMLLVQDGEQTEQVFSFTAEPALIFNSLDEYRPPADTVSHVQESGMYTSRGIQYALDQIDVSRLQQGEVLLITPGFYKEMDEVIQLAKSKGIRIHVALTRDSHSSYWSEHSRTLAAATGGQFMEICCDSGFDEFMDGLRLSARQLMVTYQGSARAEADKRHVTLEMQYQNMSLHASADYSVKLLPPEIILHWPEPAAGYSSSPADAPGINNPELYVVVMEILYPDGYGSRKAEAELYLDDVLFESRKVSGTTVEFRIDAEEFLRGTEGVDIVAVVRDEFGFQCDAELGSVVLPDVVSERPINLFRAMIVLLILAAAAAVIVCRVLRKGKRQQVPDTAPVGIEEVNTDCRMGTAIRACLIPLEGFADRPHDPFELYGTTSIGRSRKYADLLIHRDEENSPVSRLHLTILDEGDHFSVRDENSANGTYLNLEPLMASQAVRLHDGDILDLGRMERGGVRLLFKVGGNHSVPVISEEHRNQVRPFFQIPVCSDDGQAGGQG